MSKLATDPKLKYDTIGYLTEGRFGITTLVHVRSNNAHIFAMKKLDLMIDINQLEQQQMVTFLAEQQQQQLQHRAVMKLYPNGQPPSLMQGDKLVNNRRAIINNLLNNERERIHKLIKLLIKLSFHDNIVYIIEAFLTKDLKSLYIVSEYCKEENLKVKLKTHKLIKSYISDAIIFKWFDQTISALKYLHTNNIMHANIKPSNFLLASNGERIKLSDFGYLNIYTSKSQRLYYINKLIDKQNSANYDYLPKETIESLEYNYLSDVYSCACIFFEVIFLERYNWSQEYMLVDLKMKCSDEHFAYLITSMLSQNYLNRPNTNNIYKFCELKNNFYLYENIQIASVGSATLKNATTSAKLKRNAALNALGGVITGNQSVSTTVAKSYPISPSNSFNLKKHENNENLNRGMNSAAGSDKIVQIQATNKLQLLKRNLFAITYLTTQKLQEVQDTQQSQPQPQSQPQTQQQHGSFNKKFILKQIQLTEKNLNQVQNQIYKINLLNHNNLMQFYQSIFISKRLYILCEYQYNGNLSLYINQQEKMKRLHFPENLILQWLLQILNGLQYLHSNSILHTNLKCDNILFTKNNLIKLTDFGYNYLLRKIDHNVIITNFSIHYSAPEVLYSNGENYSVKSDVYSFGAVLCKCLTFKDYQQLLIAKEEELKNEMATINNKNNIKSDEATLQQTNNGHETHRSTKKHNKNNKIFVNTQLEQPISETYYNAYDANQESKVAKQAELRKSNKKDGNFNESSSNSRLKFDYNALLFDNENTNIYAKRDYEQRIRMLGNDYTYNLKQTIIDMVCEKPHDRPDLSDVLSNLRDLVSVNYSKLLTTKPLEISLNGKIKTFFSRNDLNDFIIITKLNHNNNNHSNNEKINEKKQQSNNFYTYFKLKLMSDQTDYHDNKLNNNATTIASQTSQLMSNNNGHFQNGIQNSNLKNNANNNGTIIFNDINSRQLINDFKNKLVKTQILNTLPKLLCQINEDYLIGCDSDYFYLIDENLNEIKKLDLIDKLHNSTTAIKLSNDIDEPLIPLDAEFNSNNNSLTQTYRNRMPNANKYIEINNEKFLINTQRDRINLNLKCKSICYDSVQNKIHLLLTIQNRFNLLIVFDIDLSINLIKSSTIDTSANFIDQELIAGNKGKNFLVKKQAKFAAAKQAKAKEKVVKSVYFDLIIKNIYQLALNPQGSKAICVSKYYLFICERERVIRVFNKDNGRYAFSIHTQSSQNAKLNSIDDNNKQTVGNKNDYMININKLLISNNPIDICTDFNGNLYVACSTSIEVYNDKGEFLWKHDISKDMGLISRISINKYGLLAFITCDLNDVFKNKLYAYP